MLKFDWKFKKMFYGHKHFKRFKIIQWSHIQSHRPKGLAYCSIHNYPSMQFYQLCMNRFPICFFVSVKSSSISVKKFELQAIDFPTIIYQCRIFLYFFEGHPEFWLLIKSGWRFFAGGKKFTAQISLLLNC